VITVPSNDHSEAYNNGLDDGKRDGTYDLFLNVHNPKYLADDVNGSDSEAHADYIRGYVEGYGRN
jgi:hypothetical protein